MAKDFIQKAIKKPGALRKSLGIKKGEKIPASKLKAAAKKKGKLGQRARFAMTLNKLRKNHNVKKKYQQEKKVKVFVNFLKKLETKWDL